MACGPLDDSASGSSIAVKKWGRSQSLNCFKKKRGIAPPVFVPLAFPPSLPFLPAAKRSHENQLGALGKRCTYLLTYLYHATSVWSYISDFSTRVFSCQIWYTCRTICSEVRCDAAAADAFSCI